MKIGSLFLFALIAVLALSACNLPGGGASAEEVQTLAAQTVAANLTQSALLTPSATNTTEPTATLAATNTPAVSNTPAATATTGSGGGTGGCDAHQFVTDVTINDGTEIAPDATFVKTWRLRNAGTCSWSPSYALVFVSGNAMGGAAAQNLTATVAPGTTIDISITLTAPHELGSYTGYWNLRNASNQTFGSTAFYVQIEVSTSGSSGGGNGTLSANAVGQVDASGTVGAAAHAGASSGTGVAGFVSFNISSIPSTATIEEVELDFSGFDTAGNPFASMGCLQIFAGTFFPLDASDYAASGSGPDMEWCDTSELSTVFSVDDVSDRLQAALGTSTLEYKLVFSGTPTGNALVRFLNGGMKLIVTYSEP